MRVRLKLFRTWCEGNRSPLQSGRAPFFPGRSACGCQQGCRSSIRINFLLPPHPETETTYGRRHAHFSEGPLSRVPGAAANQGGRGRYSPGLLTPTKRFAAIKCLFSILLHFPAQSLGGGRCTKMVCRGFRDSFRFCFRRHGRTFSIRFSCCSGIRTPSSSGGK